MSYTHSLVGRGVTRGVVGTLLVAAACKGRTVSVASGALDTVAIGQFKTFAIMTPTPTADTVAVGATNGSNGATGVVMDMDPMLATSLVGRAIQQDLSDAFTKRGYQSVAGTPDFHVAYYAGTGKVVDTRSSQQRYRTNGQRITTQTFVYPAGTIVVDVIDTRSDSLVWRGTALAPVPSNPNDYARAIQEAVEKIVNTFPKAQR